MLRITLTLVNGTQFDFFLASSETKNQFGPVQCFPNQSLKYLLDFFCWQLKIALRIGKEKMVT